MKALISALFFLCCLGCVTEKPVNLVACYQEFDVETFSAVTEALIEEICPRNDASVTLVTSNELRALFKNTDSSTYDQNRVRLKLEWPSGEIIFVDNDGGFRVVPNGYGRLTTENFSRLKAMLAASGISPSTNR